MNIKGFAKFLINNGEKEKEKHILINELSHEMKTPLTVILGYTELLKDNKQYKINRSYTRAINSIEAEVKRLTTIIDKYTDLSKK